MSALSLQDRLHYQENGTTKLKPTPKKETKAPIEKSRASIVAPIVNDFLRVKNSQQYQGKIYNAAWQNNVLILSKADGSTLLEAQKINGQWQSKPDNLTQQDVEFFQGLKPKIAEKFAEIRGVQQGFRQEYEQLRNQVRSDPNFKNESLDKIDMRVAMLVIKNEDDPNDSFDRVTEVLSQSDLEEIRFAVRVREFKKSLPTNDYQAQAQKYVSTQFDSALQARKEVAVQRQRSFDLSR